MDLQKPSPTPGRHPGGRTCQVGFLLVLAFWPYHLWKTWRSGR